MNQFLKMMGMFCLVMLLAVPSVSAQRSKKKNIEKALDDRSRLSGLHLESGLSVSYRNGWQLAVSPAAGYRVKKWLILGAGLNYSYSERYDFRTRNDKLTSTFMGPRAFARVNVANGFYGLLEYQYNTFTAKYRDAQGNVQTNVVDYCGTTNSSANCIHKHKSAVYLGAGMTQTFGQGFGIFYELILDVLFDRQHSPNKVAPYEIRFGVAYTFL